MRGGEFFIRRVRPSRADPARALEEVEGEVEVETEVGCRNVGTRKRARNCLLYSLDERSWPDFLVGLPAWAAAAAFFVPSDGWE